MTAIKNGTLLVKDSNGNTARVATLSQTDITTLNTALTDIKANKKKINSISANYVTTNTTQNIAALKSFVGDDSNTINLVSNSIDIDNPGDIALNGKVLFFSDKNNKNLGSVYSGIYPPSLNKGETTYFTRLKTRNNTDDMPNTYFEVQSRGNVSFAYAPSAVTHNTLEPVATVDYVNSKISIGGSNPTGTIIAFAGSSIPTGYLICNGTAVSRTTYANLFKAISTLYGAGDGSTTFNLPDLRNRFLEGAAGTVGTYFDAGLPNITGDSNVAAYWYTGAASTGCFIPSPEWNVNTTFVSAPKNGTNSSKVIWFDASKSNAIYSKSQTVQPKSMYVEYLIKY